MGRDEDGLNHSSDDSDVVYRDIGDDGDSSTSSAVAARQRLGRDGPGLNPDGGMT